MKIHSDPLGSYALMKVHYKEELDSDWIFLGPTPINKNKLINLEGASSVSVKVIRPGFFEQEKSWNIKEFLREYKKKDAIVWIPNLVQQ